METLEALQRLFGELWRTGNRWARWAIAVTAAWPLAIGAVGVIGSSTLVSVVALLPVAAIVLLLISALDPLVVAIIGVTREGRHGLRWVATIVGFELAIGVYFTIVPVRNDPSIVPLLLLASATLLFLNLGVASRTGSLIKFISILIIIFTTTAFFMGGSKAFLNWVRDRLASSNSSHGSAASAVRSPAAPSAPAPPSVTARVRRIFGVAYSQSKQAWARSAYGTGFSYPDTMLAFASGLITEPAAFTWKGGYRITDSELCLEIDNLQIPSSPVFLADFHREVSLGYAVELDNAVFGDRTISRTPMLYKTFAGDRAPAHIEKCFDVIPVKDLPVTRADVSGEWAGEYEYMGEAHSFQVRIEQVGRRLSGSAVEDVSGPGRANPTRRRADIDGWIADGSIILAKRDEPDQVAISYVAPCASGCTDVAGTWYGGLAQGKWHMKRVSAGPPPDSSDSTNPPVARKRGGG